MAKQRIQTKSNRRRCLFSTSENVGLKIALAARFWLRNPSLDLVVEFHAGFRADFVCELFSISGDLLLDFGLDLTGVFSTESCAVLPTPVAAAAAARARARVGGWVGGWVGRGEG